MDRQSDGNEELRQKSIYATPHPRAELQSNSKFKEIGSGGLELWSGFIKEAYHTELQWPAVEPLFSRIRRSDAEISIVRLMYSALARDVQFRWELPDNAGDPEKQAQRQSEVHIAPHIVELLQ